MAKVYVGGIDVKATEADIEDEFNKFGTLRSVWVGEEFLGILGTAHKKFHQRFAQPCYNSP